MKIIDQPYQFHLSSPLSTDWFLGCHLQIFRIHQPLRTWIAHNIVCIHNIILVTNMGFEMGWFIPQLIEKLVNSVVQDFNLDPQSLVWLEHYTPDNPQYCQNPNVTEFSLVRLDWQAGRAIHPRWMNMNYQDLENLLGPEDLADILGYDWQTLLPSQECYHS